MVILTAQEFKEYVKSAFLEGVSLGRDQAADALISTQVKEWEEEIETPLVTGDRYRKVIKELKNI
jgi:hypothetical protein